MKMRIGFSVLSLVALLACAKPESHPLPPDMKSATEDKAFQAAAQKLPERQRELLAGYMVRASLAEAFSGGVVKGNAKTIGDAIAEQQKFLDEQNAKEAEAKALAEKVAAERAAAIKAMDDVLTVALVEKRVIPKDVLAGRFDDVVAVLRDPLVS